MSEFVRVASASEVPPGEMKLVDVAGTPVVLANVNGSVYAFGAECTHQGGPLNEGDLEETTVTCPWHAGQFNIATGEVESPPPGLPITVYQVEVRGQDILVKKS